jgi:hypothetical protein
VFGTFHPASSIHPGSSRLIVFLILSLCLIPVAGCTDLELFTTSETVDPSPTPITTPVDPATNSRTSSSVLPLQLRDNPGQITGSAVIISDDGFLLTSLEVLDQSIEVVMPDGRTHRPALVSADSAMELAMFKIPETGLDSVDPSGERPGDGTEVFATGFDVSTEDPARMSGQISGTREPEPEGEYRVRGTSIYQTDINHIPGFAGGTLTDAHGNFCGILIPGTSNDGDAVFHAVSQWYVIAWLEDRDRRLNDLREQSESWESSKLPGGWTINHPDEWGISVQSDDDDRYRAELTPADPDIPLQLAISVEENQYGTDPESFADDVFNSRESARIWSIEEIEGRSLVRATMIQEGALVDVAYVLDEAYLIAVSLTSGYQPDVDQAQVDSARSFLETVIMSIRSEN